MRVFKLGILAATVLSIPLLAFSVVTGVPTVVPSERTIGHSEVSPTLGGGLLMRTTAETLTLSDGSVTKIQRVASGRYVNPHDSAAREFAFVKSADAPIVLEFLEKVGQRTGALEGATTWGVGLTMKGEEEKVIVLNKKMLSLSRENFNTLPDNAKQYWHAHEKTLSRYFLWDSESFRWRNNPLQTSAEEKTYCTACHRNDN